MQPKRAPDVDRPAALSIVCGEAGCSTVFFILLAASAGMLLDFQVTRLHPFFSIVLMLVAVPAALLWTLRRTAKKARMDQTAALEAAAGLAGCITVVLVFAGMFLGMALDARLDTHPVFSIGLALIVVPMSLYLIVLRLETKF